MWSYNLDYHIKSKYGCIYDSNHEVCPILSDHPKMCLFEILDDALKDLFVITLEKEFLSVEISRATQLKYSPNGRSSINEKQPQPRMTLNQATLFFFLDLEIHWKNHGKTPCLHVNCLGVSLRKVICSLTLAHPRNFTKKNCTVMEVESYCWWKKSCTSWYGKCPVIYRVSYMSGGAGFLPSTVGLKFLNIPYLKEPQLKLKTETWII